MSLRGSKGAINAGHTLVIDGEVYKLSLLPSGIVRGGKLSVIGNGVVLDPWHLKGEIAKLQGQGVDISPDNLMIAEKYAIDFAGARRIRSRARRSEYSRKNWHNWSRHWPGL